MRGLVASPSLWRATHDALSRLLYGSKWMIELGLFTGVSQGDTKKTR
ncbi:hypothetical protein A8U91_03275 [Halomonas elongata]|uniref:Uncharacterized protein n=1 Tax=Halomonas elongata TaxID=2746 RepID=A0A1B8NW57_HALEL|nr:hypothetical protein A8U91_03275 [Halomonas elongata]